ncbi:hypothetical protein RIF29_03654 [Crotalaria pallida]|uniref:Uncharacterized protein n=1 Tax=Crotalaria pallida TaxID=3830 RepID=A0AAN9J168_CROPI
MHDSTTNHSIEVNDLDQVPILNPINICTEQLSEKAKDNNYHRERDGGGFRWSDSSGAERPIENMVVVGLDGALMA